MKKLLYFPLYLPQIRGTTNAPIMFCKLCDRFLLRSFNQSIKAWNVFEIIVGDNLAKMSLKGWSEDNCISYFTCALRALDGFYATLNNLYEFTRHVKYNISN